MQNVPYYERFISTSKIKLTGAILGTGTFGEVHVVELKKDDSDEIDSCKQTIEYDYNKKYAMKLLSGMTSLTYLIREGCLLNSLNHPFIINLTACYFFKDKKFEPSFVNPIAENGTFSDLIKNKCKHDNLKSWTPFDYNKLIYDICRAIWFLHHTNIWHRDIKNDNILIMKDRTPRLSDLGLAKYKTDDILNSIIGGTPQYSPPDICQFQASFPSDVFSLGITLWEIFENKKVDSFYKKLRQKKNIHNKFLIYKDEKDRPPFSKTPEIWQNLISIMWKTNIQERPTMDIVIDLIEKPEYFLSGVDENEMKLYIKKVKKEETEAYFCKSNSTTKYLKNINSIYSNDENSINNDNNYTFNNTGNYFDKYFSNSPINKIIDQFLENSSIEDEDRKDIVYEEDCFSDQIPEKDIDERINEVKIYNIFYNSYLKLIYGLFGLSEINDEESIESIVLFCMVNLYDYVTAYKLLKKLESINKVKAKSLLSLIEEESKNSLFIKAMLFEAQEKFQEAVDTYYDCIENAEIDIRVLSRLGRLLAVLGDTEELKKEGMELLKNANNFGDQYASYTLGVIYFEKAKNEKAIKYLEKADRFPDSYLQLYNYYQKEYLKDKKNYSKLARYEDIVQDILDNE